MVQIIGSNGVRVKAKTLVIDDIIFTSVSEVKMEIYNEFINDDPTPAIYIEEVVALYPQQESMTLVGRIDNDFENIKITESQLHQEYIAKELLSALDSITTEMSHDVLIPMLETEFRRTNTTFSKNAGIITYEDERNIYKEIFNDLYQYGTDVEIVSNSLQKLSALTNSPDTDNGLDVIIDAVNLVHQNRNIFVIADTVRSDLLDTVIIPSLINTTDTATGLRRITSLIDGDKDYIFQAKLDLVSNRLKDYIIQTPSIFDKTYNDMLSRSELIYDAYSSHNILSKIPLIDPQNANLLIKPNLHMETLGKSIVSDKLVALHDNSGLIVLVDSLIQDPSIISALVYGTPDKSSIPINGYFDKFSNLHPIVDAFVTESDTSINNNLSISPPTYYEYSYKPYQSSPEDLTFLHKLFYLDIDGLVDNPNMVPAISAPTYSKFINDEQYVRMKTIGVNPHIFTKQFIDEFFASAAGSKPQPTEFIIFGKGAGQYGGYPSAYETAPYYLFDLFIGQTVYSKTKILNILPMKITSAHPNSGGSNAYGHDVLSVPKQSGFGGHRVIDIHPDEQYTKQSGFNSFVSNKYEVTYTVDGPRGDGIIYEFDTLNFSLSSGKSDSGIEAGRYNWQYQITNDIPLIDCLTISPSGVLQGRITETDVFLNSRSTEDWVTKYGYHPEPDSDWTDFEMISPRIFNYEILAIAVSEAIITIMEGPNGELPSVGNILEQTSTATGLVSKGKIVEKMNSQPISIDLVIEDGGSLVTKFFHTYKINIVTDSFFNFEMYDAETNYQYAITPAETYPQNQLSDAQAALQLDPTNTTLQNLVNILTAQISDLTTVAENNSAEVPHYNPLVQSNYTGYTFLRVLSESVNTTLKYASVVGEPDVEFFIFSFDTDGSNGLRKEINLSLPVYNNYSFDRDIWLHTELDNISDLYSKETSNATDSGYTNKISWISDMRESGYGRYDHSNNINSITKMISSLTDDYNNGMLNINKEEFDSKINFYRNNMGDVFSEEFEVLEDISPYKLTCDITLDSEEAYYKSVTDTLITQRGYAIYASCK
jgi:hypothetical protein